MQQVFSTNLPRDMMGYETTNEEPLLMLNTDTTQEKNSHATIPWMSRRISLHWFTRRTQCGNNGFLLHKDLAFCKDSILYNG